MIRFTDDEKHDLLDQLDTRGLYLHSLWGLSELFWTTKVETAAVMLHKDTISMVFNPDFWAPLSPEAQLFVVVHEQLHLMSDHFRRMKFSEGDAKNKNMAADVAINHMIVRNFGFDRTCIPEWEKYCWVDTVFKGMSVSDNQTAEYYYALLKQLEELGKAIGDAMTMDDHQYGEDGDKSKPSEKVREAIQNARQETREMIEEQEGSEPTSEDFNQTDVDKIPMHGTSEQIHKEYVRPGKNWKQLYNKIPRTIMDERTESHWVHQARRHTLLPTDLMMPGESLINVPDRVNVNVYLDTSGSCIDHARYFLRSALTLPPNQFEVNMFGFCETVYPVGQTPPNYGLKGFGAESYPAVVDHVEKWGRLDAIFVFTDGYSPYISPPNPKKWHWLITPGGTQDTIDPKCNIYNLAKFNWRS